jgi:hypothetical protein
MQSRKLTNMIIGMSSLGNNRRFVRHRRCPVSGISDHVRLQGPSFNRMGLSIYQEQPLVFLALCNSAAVSHVLSLTPVLTTF